MSRRQISRVRAFPTLLIPAVLLLTLVSLTPDAHAQSKEDAAKGFKTIMLEGTSTTPELLIQIPEDELEQFDASELETQEEYELRVQAEHEHSVISHEHSPGRGPVFSRGFPGLSGGILRGIPHPLALFS